MRRLHEQLPLLEAARTQAAQHGQLGLLAIAHSVTGCVLADLRRHAEAATSYRRCLQLAWLHSDWREWFYAQRFGELGREDLPEVRRTRRLVAAQLGPDGRARGHALWLEGAGLSMAEAMRLALAETAGD